MAATASIRYLDRAAIQTEAWDRCITEASNGLIYGYSWYLDRMTQNWSGLVLNNYEAVMPLPWKSKWGIRYLYEPFLVAQGGLFAKKADAEMLRQVLSAVPSSFRWWEFSLNHGNVFALEEFPLHLRSNYVLPLHASYETLCRGYRENIRRNIRKSVQLSCITEKGIPLRSVIELAEAFGQPFRKEDMDRFEGLYATLQEKGLAQTYGIRSPDGKLLSSCAFLFSHNRAYYILVGNHPNGRTLGSSHALIDAFIKDHAGRDLVLDFEGSDIRNLAFFYSSFGATEEKYAAIRLNRLPWWMRWAKKG